MISIVASVISSAATTLFLFGVSYACKCGRQVFKTDDEITLTENDIFYDDGTTQHQKIMLVKLRTKGKTTEAEHMVKKELPTVNVNFSNTNTTNNTVNEAPPVQKMSRENQDSTPGLEEFRTLERNHSSSEEDGDGFFDVFTDIMQQRHGQEYVSHIKKKLYVNKHTNESHQEILNNFKAQYLAIVGKPWDPNTESFKEAGDEMMRVALLKKHQSSPVRSENHEEHKEVENVHTTPKHHSDDIAAIKHSGTPLLSSTSPSINYNSINDHNNVLHLQGTNDEEYIH